MNPRDPETLTRELLRRSERSPEDDERMLYAAFANAWHHTNDGGTAEHQRAEWLVARAYSTLGNGREAVRHARRCLELTEQNVNRLTDLDRALALEAMARAHAVEGDSRETQKYLRLALEAGEALVDTRDKNAFADEFNGGEWHGVKSGIFSFEG